MPDDNLLHADEYEKFVSDSLAMDQAWMEGTLDEWISNRFDAERRKLFGGTAPEGGGVAAGPESTGEGGSVVTPGT